MGRVRSVLLIEDETDQRHLFAMELKHAGYDVTCVVSAMEARRALGERPTFDAVVADLSLPDGDSVEVLGSAPSKRPRVAILVTGVVLDRATPLHPFDHVFVKPVNLPEVMATLRTELMACAG